MYFTNGNYIMGGNFKIKKAAPMDDRGTVAKKIDLQNPNLFDGFTYNGMIVSVVDDTINNGLYRLEDKSTLTWKKEGGDVDLTNYYTKSETYNKVETVSLVNTKQDNLVSGTNIKTINGQSVLGSGNIVIIDEGSVQLTGNQTVDGIKTFSSNIVGNITGNAGTATKLQTARTINGVAFDGSANITVSDSTAVKLTGNETIADVKTFSSSPVVPTPTTDFQSVPLKSTNITVNVGAGQTYTTINQALEYLSGFYPMYKKSGVTATINLKAGFVMAEQVLVSGIDLGWITIVGEDAETIITHTALTTAFNGEYPAFGVDKGGTSPVIGQLFRFDVEKVGGNKHGLMTLGAGSSANVLSGKGFIGAGSIGILAYGSSSVSAIQANCSNAGSVGIYAQICSKINAYKAIIQNQTTGVSVVVQDGSHIVASGIDTAGGTVTAFNQAVNTLTSNGIIYQ